MKLTPPVLRLTFPISFLLLTAAFGGEIPAPGDAASIAGKTPSLPTIEAKDHSQFRLSVGAAYRSLQKVEFKTGSRSGGRSAVRSAA